MYDITTQIQSWLNVSKYSLLNSGVDQDQVQAAADYINSALSVRYDTSTWVTDETTPGMVLRMIAMLTASYTLRKAISEDEGEHTYPDWLEQRVEFLIAGIIDGTLDIPDIEPDPNAPGTAGPEFWPTDAATRLWQEEGDVEGAAAKYFSSQQVF